MFEDQSPEISEIKLSLNDFLLAETTSASTAPLHPDFRPLFKLTSEISNTVFEGVQENAKDENAHRILRAVSGVYLSVNNGVQTFCKGAIERIDLAEANALNYQVKTGVIKEPTEDQKVIIAKATN